VERVCALTLEAAFCRLRGYPAYHRNTGYEKSPVREFSKGCYRSNEISAAVSRVQLRKLEGMLNRTRALKKHLLAGLEPPRHYALQYVDDPEGDCGTSLALILNSGEEYAGFMRRLAEEGLEAGGGYNSAFPDRHVYSHWDVLYQANTGSPQNYPWNNPAYKGRPGYSRDMCPRTLDILSRSVRIAINPALTERNIEEFALAINRADAGDS